MNNLTITNSILIGIKRSPLKLLVSTFLAYVTLWAILEPFLSFVDSAEKYFSGLPKFFLLLLISVAIGLYRVASPNEVVLRIHNTTVRVVFGDLFSFEGYKAIPVSRFFLETQVVETSLQSQLIRKFLQAGEGSSGLDQYRKQLLDSLKGKESEEISRISLKQKERLYPIGTTASVALGADKYLLFALTMTELKGHIPHDNCNVTKVWIALEKFWNEVRTEVRGQAINLPLVGSGVAGINLSPQRILDLNLLAIENALVEYGKLTTSEIRIVLHYSHYEHVDLNSLNAL